MLTACDGVGLHYLRQQLPAKMTAAAGNGNANGRKMAQYVKRIMHHLPAMERIPYEGNTAQFERYQWAQVDWLRLLDMSNPGGQEALQVGAMRSNKTSDPSQYQQPEAWFQGLKQVTAWYSSACYEHVSSRLDDARVVKSMQLTSAQTNTLRRELKRLLIRSE